MRVTLNCHRAGHGPGDIVDLDDGEAAPLLALGAAFPAEETIGPTTDATPGTPTPKTQSTTSAPGDSKAAGAAETASQTGP